MHCLLLLAADLELSDGLLGEGFESSSSNRPNAHNSTRDIRDVRMFELGVWHANKVKKSCFEHYCEALVPTSQVMGNGPKS